MFKHLSEIIAQFSKTQKILALILLLLTITIVTVLPHVLDTVYEDTEELQKNINDQKEKIENLNSHINELELTIQENQIECTNRIVEREQEIIAYINKIQDDLVKSKEKETEPILEKSVASDDSNNVEEVESVSDPVDDAIDSFDNLIEKIEEK